MNKKLMITLFVVLFLFGTIHIAFADQLKFFSFKEPSNPEELRIKEKIDGELEKFRSAVSADIVETSQIDLSNFKKVVPKEIIGNQQYETLTDVFFSILSGQKAGDIIPMIYLNGDKGYILEKKATGENFVYYIENQNGWEIVKSENGLGKVIRFEDVNP